MPTTVVTAPPQPAQPAATKRMGSCSGTGPWGDNYALGKSSQIGGTANIEDVRDIEKCSAECNKYTE